jgi:hypothetical protein
MILLISGVRSVLVVDEDPAIVAKLERSLKTEGITFDIAESNATGSKMMSSGKYELAIINFESPHDIALLKLALSKSVEVVIMFTNGTTPTYLMAAKRLGARLASSRDTCLLQNPQKYLGSPLTFPSLNNGPTGSEAVFQWRG